MFAIAVKILIAGHRIILEKTGRMPETDLGINKPKGNFKKGDYKIWKLKKFLNNRFQRQRSLNAPNSRRFRGRIESAFPPGLFP
jgi:hypothetical protein